MNVVRVIEVATIALSSAIIITISLEPWELKTIYHFIVDVFTGKDYVGHHFLAMMSKYPLYFERLLHDVRCGAAHPENLPPNAEVRQKVLLGEEEVVQLLRKISVTTITKSLAALCTWSANLNLILKFGFWELGILEWIWRYQIVSCDVFFLFCLIGLDIGLTGFSFGF